MNLSTRINRNLNSIELGLDARNEKQLSVARYEKYDPDLFTYWSMYEQFDL